MHRISKPSFAVLAQLFIVGCLILLTASQSFAAELKVGIVDFGIAIQETEGKRAVKKLEDEVIKKKKELKAKESEIIALEKEIKDTLPMLSDEKKKEQLMLYQKKAYAFQQLMAQYEQEIGQKRAEVLGTLQQRLQIISVEIAQEKKLDLLIERNEGAVIYFNEKFDFTQELIKRYKKKHNK